MPYPYLLTPFIAWLVAGLLKFLINSLIAKKAATHLIGYGGLPSNHSTIVCSMVTLIGLREGIEHPAFGVHRLHGNAVLRQQPAHGADIVQMRHVGQHQPVIGQQPGGHQRQGGIFGAADGDDAGKRPAAADTNFVHRRF